MRLRWEGADLEIALTSRERQLLGQVVPLLDGAGRDPSDPARTVLERAAHPDDAEASAEFGELAREELDLQRGSDRAVVASIAEGAPQITRDDAVAAMRAINEARLVLAARSGVFDIGPGWEDHLDDRPEFAAVAWLASIQAAFLGALAAGG